jgi:hypothetical protein
MTRVQIPAYTDWWMRGARYGEIVKVARRGIDVKRGAVVTGHKQVEIAHVKLDIGGKTIKVLLDDCTEVG